MVSYVHYSVLQTGCCLEPASISCYPSSKIKTLSYCEKDFIQVDFMP